MTGPSSVMLASRSRVPRPARLFPIFVGFLLLGGPATAASQTGAPSGAHTSETASEAAQEPAGPPEARSAPYALDGRSRVEVRLGLSDVDIDHTAGTDAVDVMGASVSLQFVHWAHENLALEVSLRASNVDVRTRRSFVDETVRVKGLYGVMAGARAYLPVKGAFRPHVSLAAGPMTEIEVRDASWETHVTHHRTKLSLEVGAGVDFLFGRHFVLGVQGGTIIREGYHAPVSAGFSLGWAFGGKG